MGVAPHRRQSAAADIVDRLIRRHSTAVVLLHQAVADRLGLGPTDHKCLDLLRERGAMTGSELAAITALTTGAITGVVARLEGAGYIHRKPDPNDGRRQIISVAHQRAAEIKAVFEPIHNDAAALLEQFDGGQRTAIADFLDHMTDCVYRHVSLLRSKALPPVNEVRGIQRVPSKSNGKKSRGGHRRPARKTSKSPTTRIRR